MLTKQNLQNKCSSYRLIFNATSVCKFMKNSDFCTEWNLLVTLLIWQNSQVKQRRENLFSSWFQRFHFTVCWLYNFWTTAKQRKAVHFMVSRKQGWGRDKTYPYKACSQWLTSSTWAHFLISTIFHPSNAIKLWVC